MTSLKRTRPTKKDFAWTSWGPADFTRIATDMVKRKKAAYAAIRAIPAEERTFENTIYALEQSDDLLDDETNRMGLLQNTSPDAKTRAAAATTLEKLQQQFLDIEFDPRMYEAVKEYAVKEEKLDEPSARLLDDLLKGYARMGFDLPKAKQEKLKKNFKELGSLALAFDKNVNENNDFVLVTETELDGLPEIYKAGLERVGEKYKVTLAYPDYLPFMSGAHDEESRRKLYEKFSRVGGRENVTILKKMARLRDENAKLLGYDNFVDFQTELRTAKSSKHVMKFLNDLKRRTTKQAKADLAMLKEEKRARTGNKKATLEIYDIGYLGKQIRKEKFNIDGDLVKEYFPFEHVKQATLDIYQELLGVTFKKRAGMPLWHRDVQLFDIFDGKSNEYLASFFLDLYPREGKYGHAAAFEVTYGRTEGKTYRPPMAAMVTNFPKPTKTNPSLMSHGEVETFFHEFGHVMHNTLTTAQYRAQAGFNVAWDFVEAPSQMLENWVWNPQMLKKLTKHYKTGETMPQDLIKNIVAARFFGEALAVRTQVMQSMLDIRLHTEKIADPAQLYAEMVHQYLGITVPKRQLWIARFAHIAHGYEAGYYSYLWSKVYADDMFSRFTKEGLLNKKTGRDYRTWILEKGSSMDELELVKNFLGREPNNEAFLKMIGV